MASHTHGVLQLRASVPVHLRHVLAPRLPIFMPLSTRSRFLDCFMSQLVFFSPTGSLGTHSPAVCPPASPKAAFFPQQLRAIRPTEAAILLSPRAEEHGAGSGLLPLLYRCTHTQQEMGSHSLCFCHPSAFDTLLFIWIPLSNELFGCKTRVRDQMSPFYINGKSLH